MEVRSRLEGRKVSKRLLGGHMRLWILPEQRSYLFCILKSAQSLALWKCSTNVWRLSNKLNPRTVKGPAEVREFTANKFVILLWLFATTRVFWNVGSEKVDHRNQHNENSGGSRAENNKGQSDMPAIPWLRRIGIEWSPYWMNDWMDSVDFMCFLQIRIWCPRWEKKVKRTLCRQT